MGPSPLLTPVPHRLLVAAALTGLPVVVLVAAEATSQQLAAAAHAACSVVFAAAEPS